MHSLVNAWAAGSPKVCQKGISFIMLQKCCHYSHHCHARRWIIVHNVQHADVRAALSESIKVKGEHLHAFWSEKTSLAGDIPSYHHHPHKEDDGEVWKTRFFLFSFWRQTRRNLLTEMGLSACFLWQVKQRKGQGKNLWSVGPCLLVIMC